MGTNYYLNHICGCRLCPCGLIHIGKHSEYFTYRLYLARGIRSQSDWMHILRKDDIMIEDEYGEIFTFNEFWAKAGKDKGKPIIDPGCTNSDYIDDDGYHCTTEDFS